MYIGESRSVRSEDAIEDYIIPLSFFTKDELKDFQDSPDNDYSNLIGKQKPYPNEIFKLPLSVWKYVAHKVGSSEWHHTGKYFRPTDQYDLHDVADYIFRHYDSVIKDYKEHLTHKREKRHLNKKKPTQLISMKVTDWGGSRNYRHIIGHHIVNGYILNDNWMIPYDDSQFRYNIHANRVDNYKCYQTAKDLCKHEGIKLDSFVQFLKADHVCFKLG